MAMDFDVAYIADGAEGESDWADTVEEAREHGESYLAAWPDGGYIIYSVDQEMCGARTALIEHAGNVPADLLIGWK